ncbi:MAG: alpha/beta fold hydrolase [Candidatus Promineifilaceae bacterium]
MSIATVCEKLVHYEALGRGRPVVFVHGWLGSWRYWWPSMQALSMKHRSFAIDLWGYGDSSKDPNHYFFESYVDLLAQFVERLGIAKPLTIVGHALGAAVALRYARLSPGSVDRLVLVAMPLGGSCLNRQLSEISPADFSTRFLTRSSAFPEVGADIHKTDNGVMNTIASQLLGYDFVPDLSESRHPKLLLFGDQDEVTQTPPEVFAYMKQPGNNQHLIVLDDCGHFPMLEQPAQFNRLLLDFIHNHNQAEIAPKVYWQRRTR